jgi:hypothetical protein
MRPNGEFSVYQYFDGGSYECVLEFVDAKTAVEKAKALTETVGARMGTTRRIVITDGADNTNFEWKFGEGVTFPKFDAEKGQYV